MILSGFTGQNHEAIMRHMVIADSGLIMTTWGSLMCIKIQVHKHFFHSALSEMWPPRPRSNQQLQASAVQSRSRWTYKASPFKQTERKKEVLGRSEQQWGSPLSRNALTVCFSFTSLYIGYVGLVNKHFSKK